MARDIKSKVKSVARSAAAKARKAAAAKAATMRARRSLLRSTTAQQRAQWRRGLAVARAAFRKSMSGSRAPLPTPPGLQRFAQRGARTARTIKLRARLAKYTRPPYRARRSIAAKKARKLGINRLRRSSYAKHVMGRKLGRLRSPEVKGFRSVNQRRVAAMAKMMGGRQSINGILRQRIAARRAAAARAKARAAKAATRAELKRQLGVAGSRGRPGTKGGGSTPAFVKQIAAALSGKGAGGTTGTGGGKTKAKSKPTARVRAARIKSRERREIKGITKAASSKGGSVTTGSP